MNHLLKLEEKGLSASAILNRSDFALQMTLRKFFACPHYGGEWEKLRVTWAQENGITPMSLRELESLHNLPSTTSPPFSDLPHSFPSPSSSLSFPTPLRSPVEKRRDPYFLPEDLPEIGNLEEVMDCRHEHMLRLAWKPRENIQYHCVPCGSPGFGYVHFDSSASLLLPLLHFIIFS